MAVSTSAAVAAGVVLWWGLTRPAPLAAEALAGLEGDPARGENVFNAAGCASCHTAEDAEEDGPPVLAGGRRFPSPFGTFVAPNISPHQVVGVGGWSDVELVSAIMLGVSPEGSHYFPAFPYASYGKAEMQDVVDLVSYLRTLPESDRPSEAHEVGFPFNIRRNLGLWKILFVQNDWVIGGELSAEEERGRYLAEALAHCGECHTPRNALGGFERDRWMAGAPFPAGDGRVPNITPAELSWSHGDLVEYFTSGFTPDFDTAGGAMAEVVRTLAKLPEADRAAIASYVKALPPAE
ncbi:cytochrome c [Roseitranquillus sediminis]|uniref:cytochrome c n=1 Tax=Roseitranquillus sediminis TaxID=2809051 RepID=UPI0029CA0D58|nr:cytochrome c [Roseitranquillus sediminis]